MLVQHTGRTTSLHSYMGGTQSEAEPAAGGESTCRAGTGDRRAGSHGGTGGGGRDGLAKATADLHRIFFPAGQNHLSSGRNPRPDGRLGGPGASLNAPVPSNLLKAD